MSKLIGEPVRVHTDKDSVLTAFIWRRRVYRVLEVLGWWREPAEWWHDKAPRFFVRVTASSASAGTYELCHLGDSWFLQRVLD